MKKMKKSTSQVFHAKMRARQRLGIELNKEQRRDIIGRIQNGTMQFVRKQSNRVSVFRAVINEIDVEIVYDKLRHTIVTFLFPEDTKVYLFGKKESTNETCETIHETR